MPAYHTNPELAVVAKQIIDQWRPELKLLSICYLFREQASISDGKVTAGMCIKTDDRNWTVHKHDFIIEIAKDVWDEAEENFRLALMDHELGHIAIQMEEESENPKIDEKSGRIKVSVHKHDIEEFEDVMERHGAYHKGLRSFLRAFIHRKEDEKATTEAKSDVGED